MLPFFFTQDHKMPIALYPLISIVLYASNAFIPQLGIVASIFSPLVLMLYLAHPDRAKHYDLFFIVLIIALAVFNHILAGFYVASIVFTAFFVRFCNRNDIQRSWLPVAGSASLAFFIIFTVIYGVSSYQTELVEFTSGALKSFMDAAKEINAPMVQSPYFTHIENNMKQTALSLVLMFPAFNYIYVAIAAFVSLNLFAKIKSVPIVPFRMPDNLVWLLIASFGLIFTPSLYVIFAGVNLSIIFLTLYAFQGSEILLFWMVRFKVLPLIKAVIFIFIFSEPPIILILSLVGLFSVWFNFYGKPPEEEQEQSK
ncbi:MAG: hypothetical protein C0603_07540 [Denitrovibrio sp.]|nr:MAG: hypothetical protein C0603_07540 [Denitrovibrio sp.]